MGNGENSEYNMKTQEARIMNQIAVKCWRYTDDD